MDKITLEGEKIFQRTARHGSTSARIHVPEKYEGREVVVVIKPEEGGG